MQFCTVFSWNVQNIEISHNLWVWKFCENAQFPQNFCTMKLVGITFFYINYQKFKQSPQKSLICLTICKQFAGAKKRQKLNNLPGEQAKTLFLHRKPKRNAHFWACQIKSTHKYSRCPCKKLWQRLEYLNI